ncbi:MAG TPA: lantibiotic dehydratase [Gemmatimonadaceae bacterium]|nr:lantibiotic dehydratase [Gemmatimonadaceae bacterium]
MSSPADDSRRYRASGFFALRTPLLSFDELLAWGEGLAAPAALDGDPDALRRAVESDRALLRARLIAATAPPEVRDALFVGSPDLHEALGAEPGAAPEERARRLDRALARYFVRMAARATPFGLFAGTSVGAVADETCLTVGPRAAYRRLTRLDVGYLSAFVDGVARDPALRASLCYRPNPTLYRAAGRLRYVEWRSDAEKGRTHHLVAVDDTPYLRATLERAKHGAGVDALAAALVDDEITREQADAFVGELVSNQLLVPADLPLAVTGPGPARPLEDALRGHPATTRLADALRTAREELAAIDAAGPGADPARYRAAARALDGAPAEVKLSRLFQVELTKPAPGATLGRAVVSEILRGVELLHRLAAPRPDPFARFREAFTKRYEGRTVPLVEALDDEAGVGFALSSGAGGDGAEPLLAGLALPSRADATVPWGPREAVLMRKLGRALQEGAGEIALDARDVEEMTADAPAPKPLPDAFGALAVVAAASAQAIDRGDFRILLRGADGPSGARLLGRFCHADDALRERVEEHLREEEALDPDAVFAEVVHLSEGRLGNILARPLLRGYEIVYLGHSGAPRERQLPVTDLLVSVERDRVLLHSARLGRRVVPRLTSAHNYAWRGMAVYRFLCQLQTQGTSGGVTWDWGPALGASPFLPRVRCGRTVLSPARWRVAAAELKQLGAHAAGAAQFAAVQRWRAERRLPRHAQLADADNLLPVDFDNVLSVETFVQLVKGRPEATLEELWPGPDELCAVGPEGRFAHEVVVPYVRDGGTGDGGRGMDRPAASRAALHPPSPIPRPAPARSFPPGGDWLYLRLYCGAATADRVLAQSLGPLVRRALAAGWADRWFYVRYADPEPHLRLRFRGDPAALRRDLLPAAQALGAELVEDGRAWRVQLDTYEREVERYGGPDAIALAERVFEADSEAALTIVGLVARGRLGAADRWRLGLAGVDALLADLGLDLAAKRAFAARMRDAFIAEFRGGPPLRRQLSDRFRRERASLEALLRSGDATPRLRPGLDALRRRSERLAPVVAELRELERGGRLAEPLASIASSFAHMFLNRLTRSAARAQELVTYDFLCRLYEASAARAAASRGDGE